MRPDGVKVITEESAVADSRGNGLAESTVKVVKNLARTLLSSLNAQYDYTFGGADAVAVWLVRYCGQMLNRFRRGLDGKTAYERRDEPSSGRFRPSGRRSSTTSRVSRAGLMGQLGLSPGGGMVCTSV